MNKRETLNHPEGMMSDEAKKPGVVDAKMLGRAVDRLLNQSRPRLARMWTYYRNPMRVCGARSDGQGSDRPYRQGQEWGMPSRITGCRSGAEVGTGLPVDRVARKEVVIENDIGWRVDTMVEYLFGKPITIHSTAPDEARRAEIGELVRLIVANNGGILFLQQMALIGCVYGFVDVLVKLERDGAEAPTSFSDVQELGEPSGGGDSDVSAGPGEATEGSAPEDHGIQRNPGPSHPSPSAHADLQRVARMVRLEIVEPARALPFVSSEDWRKLEAYGQVWEERSQKTEVRSQKGWLKRLLGGAEEPAGTAGIGVEVMTPARWQRLVDGEVVAEGENTLGVLPVVHIQNLPMPFEYAGTSDVEPLIPLQDELNIRLSDRANRITMQSFKMYLGKNIDGFGDSVVAPGKVWTTENPDADVIEFGGDGGNTSEDAHIADLREAMDKSSGVSPIAAGAIKNRIGNLTSAAALRITLFSLLSKNDRKRTTYGSGIKRVCELALAWLDHAGTYRTDPEERLVEIHWPSPLPENELETLQEAELKLKLGVPQEVVLKELGY